MAVPLLAAELKDRLAAVLTRVPGIVFATVFGSVAAGTARPDSDLDIAVFAGRPLRAGAKRELIARLADASGRPVDLVDLANAGPVVALSALRGRCLIGQGSAVHGALLARAWTDAADFLPIRDRILKQRLDAWTSES